MFRNVPRIVIRYKCTIDRSKLPKILEKDIEEQFVRGSGPGGSNTNKNSNCALLRHIPTGLIVKCHKSRLLEDNRKTARLMLINKLDNLINGENSVDAQIKNYLQMKSLKTAKKKEKLRILKEDWKMREN